MTRSMFTKYTIISRLSVTAKSIYGVCFVIFETDLSAKFVIIITLLHRVIVNKIITQPLCCLEPPGTRLCVR